MSFLEKVYATSYQSILEKPKHLQICISQLDVLRFLLQLGYESKLIPEKKYIEISTPLIEIGKMLGGWKRGIDDKLKTPK